MANNEKSEDKSEDKQQDLELAIWRKKIEMIGIDIKA
jgi:hypothetical protein